MPAMYKKNVRSIQKAKNEIRILIPEDISQKAEFKYGDLIIFEVMEDKTVTMKKIA